MAETTLSPTEVSDILRALKQYHERAGTNRAMTHTHRKVCFQIGVETPEPVRVPHRFARVREYVDGERSGDEVDPLDYKLVANRGLYRRAAEDEPVIGVLGFRLDGEEIVAWVGESDAPHCGEWLIDRGGEWVQSVRPEDMTDALRESSVEVVRIEATEPGISRFLS